MSLRSVLLGVALLLGTSTAMAEDSSAAGVCTSCSTEMDFENFGQGLVSSEPAGRYTTHVFNWDTGVLYRVVVIKEWEIGGMLVVANGFPADSEKQTYAQDLYAFLKGNEYLMPLPTGGDQFPSWGQAGYEHQIICPVASTVFSGLTGPADGVLGRAIQIAFGSNPHMVTVFENGDVAHYEIIDVRPGSLSCRYVEGSARDSSGNVLDSTPEATHGDYVTPGSGSGGGQNVFVVRLRYAFFFWTYVSCARVGDDPWECHEE